MSDVLDWLNYEWKFEFPSGMYRAICARMAGTPARLGELLQSVAEEKLREKPGGKWSLKQQAGHLWVVEELWFGRFEQYVRGEARLAAADMSNRKTHEANFDETPLMEILRGFRIEREKTMRLLDRLTLEDAARVAEHPRLAVPMRLVDHCFFVAEHDDHHLAVMREMLKSR